MLNNSYSTKNLGTPSSIILNNYSIQNLIITPNEMEPYYQLPITPYENYKRSSDPITYSPSPKKAPLKNFNSLYFNPNNLSQTDPILTSNSSYNNINSLRISSPPFLSKTKNSPKIFPMSKIYSNQKDIIIERHPQDSVSNNEEKKNFKNSILNKNNNINIPINERNRILLKTSISQKHFNVKRNIHNDKDDKEKVIPFPRNNLSKKKKYKLIQK